MASPEEAVSPARDRQVGGDHYAKRSIQPWDIWREYGLNAFEGAIVKYLLRWRDKGGVEDLKKARHTLDRLIEIEEGRRRPRSMAPADPRGVIMGHEQGADQTTTEEPSGHDEPHPSTIDEE